MRRFLPLSLLIILAALFLAACSPPDLSSPTPTDQENAGMVNPAAQYCVDQGYNYEMRTDDQGNAVGVCVFDDGSECDAWAYFRGECGQDQVGKLNLNLVEAAKLADTTRIDVIWLLDPNAEPGSRKPAFSVTDPADIQALLTPLDNQLPLVPPTRCCPSEYELRFQKKDSSAESFNLGACGLFGPQSYFKGLVLRRPEAFNAAFNDLLTQAGLPH